ncbi:MAG: hypothetical protein HYZ49_07765 [Chloroflexi bacterium]|nr:hypothetical protein [Chloroflexota bacterium]
MRNKLLIVPIMALTLAALACSALSGGNPTPAGPTEVPALLKDDFSNSSSGWSTFTADEGSGNAAVEYIDGEYVMKVFTDQWYVWGNTEESFENVHIEVTAKNTGGKADTSFGIICNYQDDSHYYYAGIDTQGFYAIAKTVPGQEDFFLTNDNQWGTSDDITKDASSYQVGIDCGGGAITLYVGGKIIASASDSEYGKGDVGLFAWTDQEANGEIRFDDFIVTALP